ncbi:MAG: ISKra4 family transposase, partial [Bryobacteraceae bacterium]|nr:ISKra4 family transposase [Bryobacteraceae bacterium]
LVSEITPGQQQEYDLVELERTNPMTPANLGLAIADGKTILAAIQKQMVADQVQQHCEIARNCKQCGAELPTKGHYTSTFKSIYGKIPMAVRRVRGCRCQGQRTQSFSTMFARRNPTSPELNFISAKLAALLPFRQAASILQELLPVAETVNAGTIRNRTMRVGKRLEKHRDAVGASPADTTPAVKEVVIGLDGGYVKSCHRRPERNFEVIVGKVIGPGDASTRFAFVRGTGNKDEGRRCVGEALRARGAGATTSVTVLTDGDAGLRELQRAVVPGATHLLDWFHLAMRFQNLSQMAKGPLEPGGNVLAQQHALDELKRAKWALWHGKTIRGLARLVDLSQWAQAPFLQSNKPIAKLASALPDLVRYVELNRDSMPNYGQRYRSGQRISTSFAESSVNEILSHRMSKRQQMRWTRHTAPEFLRVRVHVLNDYD